MDLLTQALLPQAPLNPQFAAGDFFMLVPHLLKVNAHQQPSVS